MSTDVIMPQMGESIAEGTVTKWLKQIGDRIRRDEPLFEISTDKVDAEIPAPAEGVLLEILVHEGETVPINTVVARIGAEGQSQAAREERSPAVMKEEARSPIVSGGPKAGRERDPRHPSFRRRSRNRPHGHAKRRPRTGERPSPPPSFARSPASAAWISLFVEGTGIGGRVTKKDILAYVEQPVVPAANRTRTRSGAGEPRATAPRAPGHQRSTPVAAESVPAPGIVFPPGEREIARRR